MEKHSRNTVSLRLTEPVLFLRTLPGRHTIQDSKPTLLRGLLVVDLVKPTRVSSIELELLARSRTEWPEGFGARRIEVTESHKVFQASVVYFQAGQAPSRRPTSVGPGTHHHSDDDWDSPHTSPSPSNSQSLTHPSSRPARRRSVDGYANHFTRQVDQFHPPIPPYSPSPGLPGTLSAVPSPGSSSAHLPLPTDLETTGVLADSNNSFVQHTRSRDTDDQHDEVNHHPPSRSQFRSITPTRDRGNRESYSGPRHSLFSLASMSSALMDVMGLNQPRGRTLEKNAVIGRNQSQSRTGNNETHDRAASVEPPVGSKDRSTFGMISDFLKLDNEHKEYGSNWKEFKKGTYTYPISITIPGHCPPTLYCDYGNVIWTLKATVHRPGTFKAKLTATQEIIVVSCPIEDDVEESENILVERDWDNQLQYVISVSGRSFCIGGSMPVSFTLFPLAKVKIHKITVAIEERVDYYTKMTRLARAEPMSSYTLLSVKGAPQGDVPILPLASGDVEAFRKSPLYQLVTPDDDPSQMAANLMGPGPWTFQQDLPLPKSCSEIHFTNKNKWSNISITHTLKWAVRVESASDLHINPRTGKRKMFDIIVQTPVTILSCRCNPEWRALPSYSEQLSNPQAMTSSCPCEVGRTRWTLFTHPQLDRLNSNQSSVTSACSAEASPIEFHVTRPFRQDIPTLQEISSQFERLVSGQVAETGERPPAYED